MSAPIPILQIRNNKPMHGFPCKLNSGAPCLVVLTANELFSYADQVVAKYEQLQMHYPDFAIILITQEGESAWRYFGDSQAELELFQLLAQLNLLQNNPSDACLLPHQTAKAG